MWRSYVKLSSEVMGLTLDAQNEFIYLLRLCNKDRRYTQYRPADDTLFQGHDTNAQGHDTMAQCHIEHGNGLSYILMIPCAIYLWQIEQNDGRSDR